MSGYIYVIRNTINDKVYVGQTHDCINRWWHHKNESKKLRTKMLIHYAMHDLGFDNFYYQVLESNIDDKDLNDREKYWIKKLDCIHPNGYNSCVGGAGTGEGVESTSASLTQEQLDKLTDDLMYSGMSCRKLAQKYGCCEWTVNAVNNGTAYKRPNLKYPLKKSNRYDREKIKQIKYALKYELDKSLNDIAKEFGVDMSQVSEMNQGRIHAFEGETYPLRSGKNKNVLKKETVERVIDDLLHSELSKTEIARKYNMSKSSITAINNGISFYHNDLVYPLRPHSNNDLSRVKKLTIPEVEEVERLLRTSNVSMRRIAEMFGCTLTTVQHINTGSIVAYRNPDYTYPARFHR